MKKLFIILLAFVLVLPLAAADNGDLIFVTGDVNVKLKGKNAKAAAIGDKIMVGDVIMTGGDGRVEMEQKDGSLVKIAANSVFMMSEVAKGGVNYPSFACYLGGFSMKFQKLAGAPEPMIMTNTTIAAVRGTEFDVFAGADGSTLFVVKSGAVSVSSGTKTVDLGPEEGVELIAGKPLGDKFSTLGKPIDYKTWNQGRLDELLKDPIAGAKKVESILDDYIAKLKVLESDKLKAQAKYEEARKLLAQIKESQGTDAGNEFYSSTVLPLGAQVGYVILNIRHYCLSAYSLKQHIEGRLFLKMRAQSLVGKYVGFGEFKVVWDSIQKKYDSAFASYLELKDI
jgi:hypothetical protein